MRLLHSRRACGNEHAAWIDGGERIVGMAPLGRAVVAGLELHHAVYRPQRGLLRAALRVGRDAWP